MNSVMYEAQLPINGLWFFDMCEKEIDFISRLRTFNKKTCIDKKQHCC